MPDHLKHMLEGAYLAHQPGCAGSGNSACTCGLDAHRDHAKSDLEALQQRAEDLELMLRIMIPGTRIYGGAKAPGGMWIIEAGRTVRVPDKSGIPDLTPDARIELRKVADRETLIEPR
jgi:hypothetical protein